MSIEQALLDPASVYSSPAKVIDDPALDREQKVEILRRWEYDARELEVAEEENMGGGPPDMLDQILKALNELNAGADVEHSPPTKQGGE